MRAALAAACLCAALALLCAPAPVAASRPRRALLAPAPGALGQSGPRPSGTRLARTCACVDSGINSRPCFEAVTAYCSDAAGRPDARVCAAMSGFINQQDFPSGREGVVKRGAKEGVEGAGGGGAVVGVCGRNHRK